MRLANQRTSRVSLSWAEGPRGLTAGNFRNGSGKNVPSRDHPGALRQAALPSVVSSVKEGPENASVSAHSKAWFLSPVFQGRRGRKAEEPGESGPSPWPPWGGSTTQQDRFATAFEREDCGGPEPPCHIWSVDLGVKNRRIRNGNFPSLWLKRDLSQQLEHVSSRSKIMFMIRNHYVRQAESIKL